jgi:hypothetical protein
MAYNSTLISRGVNHHFREPCCYQSLSSVNAGSLAVAAFGLIETTED